MASSTTSAAKAATPLARRRVAIAQFAPYTSVASVDTLGTYAFSSQSPSFAKAVRGHPESFASSCSDSAGQLVPSLAVRYKFAPSSGPGPGAQEVLGEDAGAQERGGGEGAR